MMGSGRTWPSPFSSCCNAPYAAKWRDKPRVDSLDVVGCSMLDARCLMLDALIVTTGCPWASKEASKQKVVWVSGVLRAPRRRPCERTSRQSDGVCVGRAGVVPDPSARHIEANGRLCSHTPVGSDVSKWTMDGLEASGSSSEVWRAMVCINRFSSEFSTSPLAFPTRAAQSHTQHNTPDPTHTHTQRTTHHAPRQAPRSQAGMGPACACSCSITELRSLHPPPDPPAPGSGQAVGWSLVAQAGRICLASLSMPPATPVWTQAESSSSRCPEECCHTPVLPRR